jgi:hypothetical protein
LVGLGVVGNAAAVRVLSCVNSIEIQGGWSGVRGVWCRRCRWKCDGFALPGKEVFGDGADTAYSVVSLGRRVIVKVSGWCTAAYPGLGTPGVACLRPVAPMSLAGIVLEGEAKDVRLIL